MSDRPEDRPHSISFFPNGTACVGDQLGRQMPKYQRGWHGTTIEALKADGIDWWTLPDVWGAPQREPPSWWSPERQARQDAEEKADRLAALDELAERIKGEGTAP